MATQIRGVLTVLPKIEVDAYLPDRHEELKRDVWHIMNEELAREL